MYYDACKNLQCVIFLHQHVAFFFQSHAKTFSNFKFENCLFIFIMIVLTSFWFLIFLLIFYIWICTNWLINKITDCLIYDGINHKLRPTTNSSILTKVTIQFQIFLIQLAHTSRWMMQASFRKKIQFLISVWN